MGACLLLQSLLVVVALRYNACRQSLLNQPSFWTTMVVVNGVMLILVVGNIAQVAIGGVLLRILGEFSNFGDAVYHSAMNFTTLGYGDIVMSDKHKLLGLLEAINGVLLIGVSTAALMAFFQDAIRQTIQARQRQSDHNLNKVG